MEALTEIRNQVSNLENRIPSECQTIEACQALRKEFEDHHQRARAVARELERLQTGTTADQAQIISEIYFIIDQSITEIDQIIDDKNNLPGDPTIAVGQHQISPERAETTQISVDVPPPIIADDARQSERQVLGQKEEFHLTPTTQSISPTASSSNPVFQLQPIAGSSEQIIAQTAVLNQIVAMFNNLAMGNMPFQSSSDDPQVGGPTSDIQSLINEVRKQTDSTTKLQKEVEKIEKDVAIKKDKPETIIIEQQPLVELKLDKIQLPTFDGDLTNWIAFRDQYVDLIHNNKKFTPMTKFYQLKSHLKGLALDAINGFKLSSADYEAAWFVLMKRYNKPDQIIDEYIRRFEALPYLTQAHAIGLIKMVNAANQLIRVLPNLGVDVSTWDKWIIFNLKARLDRSTLHKWMDQVKLRQNVKLQELLEFLEIEAAECLPTEAEKTRPTMSKESFKNSRRSPRKFRHATAMVVTAAQKCGQCNGEHPLYRCPTFKALPVADRIKKVKALKLCIRCLQMHQHPADCKFGACPTCTKDHNSLLCLKREQLKNEKEQKEADSAVVA